MRDEQKAEGELRGELRELQCRIAELEQTNRELREAVDSSRSLKKQLKDILDNTPVGVYRTTPDGRILMANPALVRMLGYSSFEELAVRNLEKDGYEPQYPRSTFKERIEKDGQVIGLESGWIKRDGTTLVIIETAWAVRDKRRRTLYYEGIVQDITELKKSKEALERSEQEFRSIFDNATDGIVLADIESKKFTIANKAFSQMLGCNPEEVKNLSVADIHPGKDVPYVIEQFERQSRREISLARDIPVKRKDGSVFYADINAFLVTLAGKAYIAGIFRDVTERKQTEDETRLLKRQLEFILGTTKTGLDIIDSQFNIRFIDPEWQKIYGDPTGKKCYKYFMGRNKVCPDCGIVKALQTKSVIVSEEVLVKENNRPIQVITIPFQDEKGEWLVAEVNVDITERKRAEKSLRESEEMVRAILDATTESVLLLDKQGTVLAINKTGSQRFGKKAEELVGFNLRDFTPDLASLAVIKSRKEHIDKVVHSGEPVRFEDQRAGMIFDTNCYPLFDEKGQVTRLAIFARDITQQKKNEETLRELKHRYQTLFESAPVGIGVSTPEGKVLECNDAMLKMLGYSETEVKQINLRDTYKDPQRRQELLKQLQRDGFIRDFEVQLKQKDGTAYYASLTIAPFIFNGQNVLLAVQENITERKQAQEMLNSYREKMIRAERLASLGALGASLAHELAQPLTVTTLSLENALTELKAMSSAGTVIEKLKDSLNEISNITSTVERFRNYARKSSKEICEEVNLKVVAERTTGLLSESARRARVILRLKGLDELPPVYLSEKDIEQVFFALIENAIQAANGTKDCEVIIGGAVKGEYVELQFSDNCGGIAPENLGRIFEPFFTTKPTAESTGLGLCIVEHVVSRAGGKIRVESRAGKGSTFFVTLPINADEKL